MFHAIIELELDATRVENNSFDTTDEFDTTIEFDKTTSDETTDLGQNVHIEYIIYIYNCIQSLTEQSLTYATYELAGHN